MNTRIETPAAEPQGASQEAAAEGGETVAWEWFDQAGDHQLTATEPADFELPARVRRLIYAPCGVAGQATQTAPQAAAKGGDDARDAARYRWLRANWFTMSAAYPGSVVFGINKPRWSDLPESDIDAAIDRASASVLTEGGKR